MSLSPVMSSSSSTSSSSLIVPAIPLSDFFPRLFSNVQFTSPVGLLRVCLAAWALGFVTCLGVLMFLYSHPLSLLFLYFTSLSVFHSLEFVLTSLSHPHTLSFSSFLLNHSREFHYATLAAIGEFIIEFTLFPNFKQFHIDTSSIFSSLISLSPLFGLLLLFVGQLIRSMAMYQCGSNFTHLIADSRLPSHSLVTSGIYAYLRHPSYTGWFLWSLGTQLLAKNFLCFFGYFYVAWKFFRARIVYEEIKMIQFFGKEYREYQNRVWIGLPGIQKSVNKRLERYQE
jgi:protein-S-isoprenylcysteine O-methyltransferase